MSFYSFYDQFYIIMNLSPQDAEILESKIKLFIIHFSHISLKKKLKIGLNCIRVFLYYSKSIFFFFFLTNKSSARPYPTPSSRKIEDLGRRIWNFIYCPAACGPSVAAVLFYRTISIMCKRLKNGGAHCLVKLNNRPIFSNPVAMLLLSCSSAPVKMMVLQATALHQLMLLSNPRVNR